MEKRWLGFAVLLTLALGAAAIQCPLLHAPESASKTGCYVVVLQKDTSPERFDAILKTAEDVAEDNKLYVVVKDVSKAFSVKLTPDSLALLREIKEVEYIEEETMAEVTEVPYHLDRVDQRQLPLDGIFNPMGDGEGVDIYILDTGIFYEHSEFGNRAKFAGLDPMDLFLNETMFGEDCFGHGTHVASTAAGVTYGAAKNATVYSVRVLDCGGFGPWSVILLGMDFAMSVISVRGRPAIVSMSLGGFYTQFVNDAVQTLHNSGIPVVVAAGNGRTDACYATPASAPDAITVAGSANDDELYFRTNYGSCVDLFAPGALIQAADYTCPTCFRTGSGTSYAAPIVSGAVAILLQRNPGLTPAAVTSELLSLTVKNALNFSIIPEEFKEITPNNALFIPAPCGGEFSINVDSSIAIQSPNYPSHYAETLRCKWVITAPWYARLDVKFTDFATEFKYDTVKLCNTRNCKPSTRLVTLSGLRKLSPCLKEYKSKSNVLTIELNTDRTTSQTGFNATVTAIVAPILNI